MWKPLKKVTNWPLALCDATSVQYNDLVASDLIRRKTVGESWYCQYNSGHSWYYLSDQAPDEVTMLKIQDSREEEPVRCESRLHVSINVYFKADCRSLPAFIVPG